MSERPATQDVHSLRAFQGQISRRWAFHVRDKRASSQVSWGEPQDTCVFVRASVETRVGRADLLGCGAPLDSRPSSSIATLTRYRPGDCGTCGPSS
jgi:hypothetical protein